MKLLISWVVMSLAVAAAGAIVPGIEIADGVGSWFLIAAVLGVVNVVLGTIVRILALPITILTLGLFSLVINGLMLSVTDSLLDSLTVDGFWSAILGGLVISLVSTILDAIVSPDRRDRDRERDRSGRNRYRF